MSEPERITVVRYRCPHCHRSHANRKAAAVHMDRCWYNPQTRSCKTCSLYSPAYPSCGDYYCNGCGSDEECGAGIVLPEHGLITQSDSWASGEVAA